MADYESKKVVFFGPWVGEFGWEFMHWHAWVNRVCAEDFVDYHKIVSSYSGREPFYPLADEYYSHPSEFQSKIKSARNYIADHWINDRPQPTSSNNIIEELLKKKNKETVGIDLPLNQSSHAESLLDEYKKILPKDTVYFVPWKDNYYEKHDLSLGIEDTGYQSNIERLLRLLLIKSIKRLTGSLLDSWNWLNYQDFNLNNEGFLVNKIPFSEQKFFKLMPSDSSSQALSEMRAGDNRPIISLFPRYREERRADKNWDEENYINLIRFLQKNYPGYQIALLGEPGGCYFVSQAPEGCLDLINIDSKSRMDMHVAALSKSALAIGGLSGALLVALASGCKSVVWGEESVRERFNEENQLGTQLLYIGEQHPENSTIEEAVKSIV